MDATLSALRTRLSGPTQGLASSVRTHDVRLVDDADPVVVDAMVGLSRRVLEFEAFDCARRAGGPEGVRHGEVLAYSSELYAAVARLR